MSIVEACRNGDCASVLELLREGADINALYLDGMCINSRLLHTAIAVYNIDMVALLIKQGANINCVNYYGSSPLLYSIWYAIPYNTSTTIFEFLLSAGADIDEQHITTGNTILHELTMYSWHIEYARILLNHGADAEIKNNMGETPLDIAQDDDVRLLLQEYIASRNVKNAGRRK